MLTAGLVVSIWQPAAHTIDTWAAPVTLYAAIVVAAWLAREHRLLLLWFGVPLLFYLFFVEMPRTHSYVFFVPWTLLSGMALARGWQWLREGELGYRLVFAWCLALRPGSPLFVGDNLEVGEPATDEGLVETTLADQSYQLLGTVIVNDQPRLRIYEQPGSAPLAAAPQEFDAAGFERTFDRKLADPISLSMILSWKGLRRVPGHCGTASVTLSGSRATMLRMPLYTPVTLSG